MGGVLFFLLVCGGEKLSCFTCANHPLQLHSLYSLYALFFIPVRDLDFTFFNIVSASLTPASVDAVKVT